MGSNPTASANYPRKSVVPILLRPDFSVVFGGYVISARDLVARGKGPLVSLARLTPAHSHIFAHAMLTPAAGAACSGCHTAPKTIIHAGLTAQCSTCHSQTNWAAATIDHRRFFALTGPHDVACTSCHTTANDFSQYTCYSCHAHQESDLIREHLEEGIGNIDNCVACHRDAEGREGDDD